MVKFVNLNLLTYPKKAAVRAPTQSAPSGGDANVAMYILTLGTRLQDLPACVGALWLATKKKKKSFPPQKIQI